MGKINPAPRRRGDARGCVHFGIELIIINPTPRRTGLKKMVCLAYKITDVFAYRIVFPERRRLSPVAWFIRTGLCGLLF